MQANEYNAKINTVLTLWLLCPILLTPLGNRYMKRMSLAGAEWDNTAARFRFALPMNCFVWRCEIHE